MPGDLFTSVASASNGMGLLMVAVTVMALVMLGSFVTPRAFMDRRLRRVAEGAGLTVSHRTRQGEIAHSFPRVMKRARTLFGYRLTVALPSGMSVDDVTRHVPELADGLSAQEVRVSRSKPGVAVLDVYMRDATPEAFNLDMLHATVLAAGGGGDLWLPVGIRDDGSPYRVGLGHLLIVGATGSGKGSALWSVIRALDALRSEGLAILYGIDPKRAELAGVGAGFERVEYDHAGALALLEEVGRAMDERKLLGLRSFAATVDRPWLVLVLDEFNGLLNDPETARRKRIAELLHMILSQGRSLGVVVVAAAQNAQKESLGQLRTHFQTRIALRVETATDVDMVLGAGSAEAGARAHEIPPATESNGYATAGVAYARSDGEPVPVQFRFPFVRDAEIAAWVDSAAEGGKGHV